MSNYHKTNKAFTLIELLVVIAIIGILSSVVLAALSGARDSAKVTRMVSDLEQIETGMIMWMDATGKVKWPEDSNYTQDDVGPLINTLRNESSLSEYLNKVPDVDFGSTGYLYRNQGSTFTGCGDAQADAVTVTVRDVSVDVAEELNRIIENDTDGSGNQELGCGKFRQASGGDIFYGLSNDQSL